MTNYDTLVEQAFRAAGKPYDLVVYPTDRKDFANAILWWRHGSSDDDEDQLPSWAIQRNPSELEGKLWAKRRVGIFDLPLDEFVSRMREQMGR